MIIKYAIFFCTIKDVSLQRLHLLTNAAKEECANFSETVGDVIFYTAEAKDLKGDTPNEKLSWELVGLDMKLKHGNDNVYLVIDQ